MNERTALRSKVKKLIRALSDPAKELRARQLLLDLDWAHFTSVVEDLKPATAEDELLLVRIAADLPRKIEVALCRHYRALQSICADEPPLAKRLAESREALIDPACLPDGFGACAVWLAFAGRGLLAHELERESRRMAAALRAGARTALEALGSGSQDVRAAARAALVKYRRLEKVLLAPAERPRKAVLK